MLLKLDKITSFYSFVKFGFLQFKIENNLYEIEFDYVISQGHSYYYQKSKHLHSYFFSHFYITVFAEVRVEIVQEITVFKGKDKYALEINSLKISMY